MRVKYLSHKYKEPIMYIILGVLTTIINWLIYIIFILLGKNLELTNIVAWIGAVLFAYITNKTFVFQSKAINKNEIFREFITFLGSRVATGMVEIIGFPFLYHIGLNQAIGGVDGFLAKIIISVIVIILNYICSKLIVFKK